MKGLRGNEIPLNARIFTIVDVFDALTSKRPYKEPFGFDESMKLMKPDSGKRFDPGLFKQFSERADALHQQISRASDEVLESMLGSLIRKHFFNEK
jgi:HD-GYP domain-containing protein (c-di-GMP phosphodiesterase class II)